VAHVQRPRGIGRHELHHDLSIRARGAAPECRARAQDLAHHHEARGAGEREVDEAGARDLGARDVGIGSERGEDRLGRLARLPADALGELQGDVGREVAMIGVLRPVELDHGVAVGKGLAHGVLDQGGEARFRIVGRH